MYAGREAYLGRQSCPVETVVLRVSHKKMKVVENVRTHIVFEGLYIIV